MKNVDFHIFFHFFFKENTEKGKEGGQGHFFFETFSMENPNGSKKPKYRCDEYRDALATCLRFFPFLSSFCFLKFLMNGFLLSFSQKKIGLYPRKPYFS